MKKWIFKFADLAPVIMLGITVICAVLVNNEIYIEAYRYLPDLLGYSVLTNIVFLRLYWNRHYCNPTKASVIGLLTMNIVSILTKGTEYYNALYDVYIGGAVFVVIIIWMVKRW